MINKTIMISVSVIALLLISGCEWMYSPIELLESCSRPSITTVAEAESECKNLANDPAKKQRDHCYQNMAWDSNNAKICEKIQLAGPKSKCLMLMAEEIRDIDLCESMEAGPGAYSKDECYEKVAKASRYPALCDKIQNTGKREECKKYSQGTVKPKLCGKYDQPCCGGEKCSDGSCNKYYRCTSSVPSAGEGGSASSPTTIN